MTETAPQRAVVVGIDGSDSALHAVRWGAREAVSRGVPLRLFHVCLMPPLRVERHSSHRESVASELVEQGWGWLADARHAAAEVAPDVEVSTDLRMGNRAELLLAQSGSAVLMVLGSRGLGGFSELLLGSVATALASHGRCPVVVVRGRTLAEPPPQDGPVVVGVDGSAISDAAVDFAFDIAARRGVPLLAVHTWTDVTMDGSWSILSSTVDHHNLAGSKRKLLDDHLTRWRRKYPDVDVHPSVVHDRPVRGLLAAALPERGLRAQLIVVGSRGRGPATAMGIGSTSWSLLHYAECPVAVVRPGVER